MCLCLVVEMGGGRRSIKRSISPFFEKGIIIHKEAVPPSLKAFLKGLLGGIEDSLVIASHVMSSED